MNTVPATHRCTNGKALPRNSTVRSLLHLGRRRSEALHWTGVESVFDLDDILGAAEARANVASLPLVRARAACAELAGARFPAIPDEALPLFCSAQA